MRLRHKLARYLVRSLMLGLAYLGLGLLGLQLAGDPAWVSVLFPASGLALAGLLVLGWRYAPCLVLASFTMNLLTLHGAPWIALGIGLACVLQALAGAWLVQRYVSRPLLLSEPRDLLRFALLGGALACVVSPTLSLACLWLGGRIAGDATLLSAWLSWWIGDTNGVLIAAPIVLSLIGRPRRAWVGRRLSVGLPLLVSCLLMAWAAAIVSGWDRQRAEDAFERDALTIGNAVQLQASEPLLALEATRSMALVAPQLSRQDFELGTRPYLRAGSSLLALGLARVVPAAQQAAFERAARAEGLAGYRVFNRPRPGDQKPPAGEDAVAIRLIEPMISNAGALGVNIRSIPVARRALELARKTGLPSASAGFEPTQHPEQGLGVVVYAALYAGDPSTANERATAFSGAISAILRPAQLLAAAAPQLPAHLRLCLVDLDPDPDQRLAGEPDCEALSDVPTQRRTISFGGRQWDLRVYAPNGLPQPNPVSVPFAMLGTMVIGLLGMLLLMISGRTQRVENEVRLRTAQLQREIADREEATQALTASEQRLREIFDTAPIGIVFTSVDGVFKAVNPHFCAMLGLPATALLERHVGEITAVEDRDSLRAQREQIERGELREFVANRRLLCADGTVLQTRITVRLMRSTAERPLRLVATVQDISDEHKMRELERARQTAEAANQAKTEFLSRMSHELRTPLNAMLGFTQLLEMDSEAPLSARQHSRTAQIQQAGWHLLEMINDTLDLSRIEAGALRLDPAMLDLAALLPEAQALVEADAQARHVLIRRELGASAGQAFGDATRVKQIVTNLLSNAVKYNRPGGAITLLTEMTEPGWVDISVADTGLGLSAEQLAQLYQPFNRLGREHGGPAGTGIGLVICKRLAELMGGSLRASSTEGLGSVFVLRLPASGQAASPEAVAESAPQVTVQQRRRVLYIEDNAMNAAVMQGIFEQRPLLQLKVETRGKAGLAEALKNKPDLLLLDMHLPDLDGLEVLRRLRLRWNERDLPVIAVSANALPEQIAACRALGVREYITKPVDLRQVLKLLDRVLA